MSNKKDVSIKSVASFAAKIALILAILFLIVYAVTIITGSGDFYTDSAERSALMYFDEDLGRVTSLANTHYDNLYKIVEKIQYAASHENVEEIIKSYIGTPEFGDLRFYSQGKAYSPNGLLVEGEASGEALITALSSSMKQGCTEVYRDDQQGVDCIAFFVPVRGSAYVDGLLSIVPARNIISVGDVINEKATSVAIIDKSGMILSDKAKEGFGITLGNNYYTFINDFTSNNAMAAVVGEAVSSYKKTTCTVTALGSEYCLAISPIEAFDGNLTLITMSESRGLIAPEMTYIRHLINILVIAVLSIIIGAIYAALYYSKIKTEVNTANLTNPTVGCANTEAFCRVAASALKSESHRYVIAALSIRQFRYMADNIGEEKTAELLQHIAKVTETFCNDRETFAYNGDGIFLILASYDSERSLKEKIKLIETVANKHELLKSSRSKLKFNVGVSLAFDSKRYTVKELVSRAITASEQAKSDIRVPYVIYNEKVNESREHDDRIEAQMESALENREFRLFLQPKYNVAGDKIDSAEALVRWFDPRKGEYMFPGEFISLFESNGFITKLDHFVYIEVLEYLSSAAERGDKIVPIAVNVSRVTASSPDFLNFYVGNKRKYGIGEGFITLEFTESFAMEDYDKIYEIVDYLHKNGMRCSIDDFGSGYSSFSILKQVPVDELKLDRFFLEGGINKKNDEILLETVISLAKSLGMKVVQEGVETKEMFDKIVSKGCDIVQGYYYAKAIPLEEYKLFINSNTSIKYKSLVK